MKRIAEQVKALRNRLGLTQVELATRAGVGRRTVMELERGGSITSENLEKILHSIGMTLVAEPLKPTRPTLDDVVAENEEEDAHRFDA